MNNPLRIVFFGTPEFAVASLNALLIAGYDIAAVVTAPDKPSGRGLKLTQSAVKVFAENNSLMVLQPQKLRDLTFIDALTALKADLFVVVAFRMLPEVVWNLPPLGSYNLHGSLLPAYRGAAPINWAIINGENITGVTTFKLKHEIDKGDWLLQKKIEISENETAGMLHDKMMYEGASLLVDTITKLQNNTISAKAQPSITDAPHAPKIHKNHCQINWQQNAQQIHNLIRGLSPFPGAFTFINGQMLKIYQSKKVDMRANASAGCCKVEKDKLYIATNDFWLEIIDLQLAGKKRMDASSFLRGYSFDVPTICSSEFESQ